MTNPVPNPQQDNQNKGSATTGQAPVSNNPTSPSLPPSASNDPNSKDKNQSAISEKEKADKERSAKNFKI